MRLSAVLGLGLFAATGAEAAAFVFGVNADGRLTAVSATGDNLAALAAPAPPGLFLFAPNPSDEVVPVPAPLPAARAEILQAIEATARRYAGHAALRDAALSAADWARFFQANIEVESGYNPAARSPVGAIGLGQLMPDTARALGVDATEWQQNLDGSARYLLQMLESFGTPALALAAYNAGPQAVSRHGGMPPFLETQNHVARVQAVYARLKRDLL